MNNRAWSISDACGRQLAAVIRRNRAACLRQPFKPMSCARIAAMRESLYISWAVLRAVSLAHSSRSRLAAAAAADTWSLNSDHTFYLMAPPGRPSRSESMARSLRFMLTSPRAARRRVLACVIGKTSPKEVWWPGPSNAFFFERNSNRGALCLPNSVDCNYLRINF